MENHFYGNTKSEHGYIRRMIQSLETGSIGGDGPSLYRGDARHDIR